MRLTASRQVAKVITGCKPKSAAVLPAITDIPYSAPPGRTQSPCEPGQPSTAAELASERGPGRPAVASAHTCSCSRDCRLSDATPSNSSGLAKSAISQVQPSRGRQRVGEEDGSTGKTRW